jgi:hypothetical protein
MGFEPRLAVKVLFTEGFQFKAGYDTQTIHSPLIQQRSNHQRILEIIGH